MAGGGGGEGLSLLYTPTWVVALVCTVIVAISLVVERLLHYAGKYLLKKNQGSLFQALLKIKEELMLLGFISLLLTVFQSSITKICIPKHLTNHWLPCKKLTEAGPKAAVHFEGGRHLLAAASDNAIYCDAKGKAPLLSLKAVDDLHIFIFVLAVAHVVFSALTILFGGLKIRQWRYWEDSIQKREFDPEQDSKTKVTHVHEHAFIRSRFSGIGRITLFSWLKSFFKQFYGSVNKSDYTTLRLGFVMTHCRGNPKFNFYKYMTRALEHDFKKVVGISWYLWAFVFFFLLLNVYGWHAYFWISFFPLILLLAVGTKLEHIITQLAEEVAQKHSAVAGDLIVRPSDDHFWFQKPRLVLILIHVILFQNSFEIAVFFWMLVLFGFDSCIMGQVGYIVPRLVIGVFVQFLCSYSTLPLYAIVTQMGSSFNVAIFEDHIKASLVGWAQKAKKNRGLRKVSAVGGGSGGGSNQVVRQDSPERSVEMLEKEDVESAMYQGKAREIQPALP
ncbi:MLO-like protein 1 [Olea europaea var. sylvestris]|uniref:MLO-like protein 1 n=1 Tax=Olea europaea var. sylvestris TaxID=158386 RepID=UPI000C1D4953|nr:MLO-like protein 1 [Olea europaea var. sylvestris]